MKPTWKKIKSKIVHENPWYKIREDDVIRPDGSSGKYFVLDGINSVAVIVKDDDYNFYLVEQTRYPIGNILSLEVVTGGIKGTKDPLEVAKCELQEEIGATAESWTSLGYFFPVNGYDAEKCHVFLATGLTLGKNNPEATEDITIVKLNKKKLISKIQDNSISDGITVAAFYKYLLYEEREIP